MKQTKVEINAIVNAQAYKHNGKLYRQWNGIKLIDNSKDAFVALMVKTKVAEAKDQKWIVREPVIWFFPKNSFYNTTCLIKKNKFYFYTNISSPPIIEENTIKFIDYDLDIKAYPQEKVKVIDVNEFKYHSEKYHYPEKLISLVNKTVKNVQFLIRENKSFFNPSVIRSYIMKLVESKDLPKKMMIKK